MPSEARVALITGCGKPVGIGNSTARALAAAGVTVVVSDVSPAGIANEHNEQGDMDPSWTGIESLVRAIVDDGSTESATLGDLSEAALIEILTRPKNALAKQYQRMFEREGVKLRFQEEALHAISRRAIKRKTGARGLRSIMEGILLETMFELPNLNGVQEVVITADVVEGRSRPLYTYSDKGQAREQSAS